MTLSILVCVKTIPNFSEGAALIPKDHWISEEDLDWQMNPYDTHAVEAALVLKEKLSDVRVEVLSAGGEHAPAVIRRAMAMGADHGIHLTCDAGLPRTPEGIASAIAAYAKEKHYDFILAGAISADAMNGTTGPLIAAMLDLPCAVGVTEMTFLPEEKSLILSCELEGGLSEKVRLLLPALVTVQTGNKTPRYPSLSNTLRARRQPLEEIRMAPPQEGLGATPVECFFPEQVSTCRILTGTSVEKAEALLAMFHHKGWLK